MRYLIPEKYAKIIIKLVKQYSVRYSSRPKKEEVFCANCKHFSDTFPSGFFIIPNHLKYAETCNSPENKTTEKTWHRIREMRKYLPHYLNRKNDCKLYEEKQQNPVVKTV